MRLSTDTQLLHLNSSITKLSFPLIPETSNNIEIVDKDTYVIITSIRNMIGHKKSDCFIERVVNQDSITITCMGKIKIAYYKS